MEQRYANGNLMRNRAWWLGLTACVALLLAAAFAIAVPAKAYATPVDYIYRYWDGTKVVEEQRHEPNCQELNDIPGDGYVLSGWYIARGFSDGDRPKVQDTANIIIENGREMSLRNGIEVPEGSTLNIYTNVWPDGTKDIGKLYVGRSEADTAAIGGNSGKNSGTINIYGAIVDVRGGSHDTDGGAGIGGGNMGGAGNIAIYGGTVTAKGGPNAAGIGGGDRTDGGTESGSIIIYGGTVNATGGSDSSNGGAGIGGGGQGRIDNIEIYGGTVTAKGGANAAGIGGGAKANSVTDSGKIQISGGNVTAVGDSDAAGIGGGMNGVGKNITVNGGTVSATGGSKHTNGGAGIGGGGSQNGENITIGGNANITKAQGGANAAGIGGGDGGEGKNIKISGGTVNAHGGSENDCGGAGIGSGHKTNGDGGNTGSIEITGGKVTATGGHDGAGIGGGENKGGGTITISGGEVNANGGKYGAGIGGGQDGKGGTITITSGTITAKGGASGAGIGGGDSGEGGAITIEGGAINATGGELGAGIGSGEDVAVAGTINISGGTITARGGNRGAGVGGGDCGGRGGQVNITGGTVKAYGGTEAAGIGSGRWSNNHGNDYYSIQVGVTIDGENTVVRAYAGAGGAGIGGGNEGPSGTILIKNGDVFARGGRDGGPGIGSGSGCWHDYTETKTVNVTIQGGEIEARAGNMYADDKTNSDPGAAIGAGGCEHAADSINQEYEAVFRGGVYLTGGHIKAYAADITRRTSITNDVLNVIGTTYKDKGWTDEKSEVVFGGATVDMYPGAGTTTGTIKQMVKVNGASDGGIKYTGPDTMYQRVTFTTQYDDINTMTEAKLDYRTLVLTGAEEIEEYGGTKLENAEYKHIRVEPAHKHVFTYALGKTVTEGDTITATCAGGDGCTLNGQPAKLILSNPPHEVYGDGKDAAVVVTDENHIGNASVVYYPANPTTGDKESSAEAGDNALLEIPKDAGTYWAEITLSTEDEGSGAQGHSEATAHVSYTIEKATPTVIPTAVVDELSDRANTLDLSEYVKNAPAEGVYYELANAEDLREKGIEVVNSSLQITQADPYIAKPNEVVVVVSAAGDDNHKDLNGSITVTINKKPRPTIAPDEVTFIYGDASANVGATATGDEGKPTGAISYAVKNVSASDAWLDDGESGTGGNTGGDDTWSENEVLRVNKSTGQLVAKKLGTTTVTVTVAGNDYYAPTVKDVAITVKGAPLTGVSARGYEGTYDGNSHGISVTKPNDISGLQVYYATTELTSENYQIEGITQDDELFGDLVKFKDAGTYTVYYYVTAPLYEPVAGSATVTISKKPIEAAVWALDKEYDGTTEATVYVYVAGGLVGEDYIEIDGVTGTFANKNAGESKPVILDASGMTLYGDNTDNYEVTIPVSTTATIEKAWAIVVADDVYVPVNTALPEEYTATSYTPVEGEEIDSDLSCAADIAVPGTYEIIVTALPDTEINKNYDITCINGTLTVTRPIEVNAQGYSGTYDGNPHSITVAATAPGIPSIDDYSSWTAADWAELAEWAEYLEVDTGGLNSSSTPEQWVAWADSVNLKQALAELQWITVYYGTEKLTSENYLTAGTTSNPTFTNAGTYTVYYFVVAMDGQTVAGSKDVVIEKANPEVTAPTPKTELEYDGNLQQLIAVAGSTNGGTMEYSLDGMVWNANPTVIAATKVGSSYILSATSRAVAAPFSFRREYGIKGVHGAEGAGCVLLEFGSSR